MSRAVKCDRCGQYTETWKSGREANCTVTTGALLPVTKKYDLCPKCVEELKEFMREREENE